MRLAYEKLSKRYKDTKIEINNCHVTDGDIINGLTFEFCNGVTLEAMLDECLMRADMEGFRSLVDEYMYWLSYKADEFTVSNIDFVFPNIIINKDRWQVIDYEWTYMEYVEPNQIAFRSFYNYMLGGEARRQCEKMLFGDVLGFGEEEVRAGIERENKLQHQITADHASVEAMREIIGNKAYELEGMLEYCRFNDNKFAAQMFFDYGDGFSEENSIRLRGCYNEQTNLVLDYMVPEGVVRLRLDPCEYCCSVLIRKIQSGGHILEACEIETNGYVQENGEIVFATIDPNIAFPAKGGERLICDMRVFELSPELAGKFIPQEQGRESVFAKTKEKVKQRLNIG
jgi:hypothetical protein